MKWIKNLKWVAGASTLLAMLAVVPVVHGGGRWSGIDPELKYGGHKVNIWVEWPGENTCSIDGLIGMEIAADSAVLVLESVDSFPCAGGTATTVQTNTSMKNSGKRGELQVKHVMVQASDTFPVNVLTYVDGVQEGSCSGHSNERFDCGVVRVFKK